MSANLLSQLLPKLSKINQYILEDDIDSAQSELNQLDDLLKNVFNSPTVLTEDDTLFLSDFSTRLNTTVQELIQRKGVIAKKIGVHLNTQKKINVYKSIK
ncbi:MULTISPECIES: hypothetical protein [Pseudoalteromonas]|uniref:hypothetical protein n=1 Tax=Pseudoalteromonas TaxID=53246 RepID=UPI0007DB30C4|nr:hypothetical protein [Pseudoalteromonas neustonica]